MTKAARSTCAASLIALIVLCVVWELWAAPLRPGGSWLVLKALPLLAPLKGVLRGHRYTYKWAMMLALAYLMEGLTRAYTDRPMSAHLALAETVLSFAFFLGAIVYLRGTRPLPPSA